MLTSPVGTHENDPLVQRPISPYVGLRGCQTNGMSDQCHAPID